MATEMHNVQVSESLYRRLERLAALTHQPVDGIIAQALSASIPPLPDDLTSDMRDALLRLESLSDVELWDQTRAMLPEAEYERLTELRERRREGTLAPDEMQTLDTALRDADMLMLKKAYAAVLLKWRGQHLPSLAEARA